MKIVEITKSYLSLAAIDVKPKVVVVPLPKEHGWNLFAIYHLHQGKRAGRKTDFTGCHRLDGLFVEDKEAPASGVVVIVPSVEKANRDRLVKDIDSMIWGPGAVRQILLTDSATWLALVKKEDGDFFSREGFTTPHESRDSEDPAAIDRLVMEQSLFHEKIRRALLPWKCMDDPKIFAWFAISYIRQVFFGMRLYNHTSLINDFVDSLENELGMQIRGQGQQDTAEHLLAVLSIMDGICAAVFRKYDLPLTATTPTGLAKCIQNVQSINTDSCVDQFDIIAEHLTRDLSPSRITEFCKTFWNGLPNGDVVWDAVSSLSDEIADAHIDFLRSRLAAEVPLFAGFGDKRISWLDPHAGTGNLFIRALYGGKNNPGIQGPATAIESSPMLFYLLRLRVIAALGDLSRAGKQLPRVHLTLANPRITPEILQMAPESPLCVVSSDLRINEEKRVYIAGDPALVGNYKTILRDTWGMLALYEQDGFAQYAALMDDFLQSKKYAAALFFTPRAWLDNDIFAATRMAWGNAGDKMYVTTLPEDFSQVKQVRKAGLVSAVILRLMGRNGLAVYGQDIRYNEDITTGMAEEAKYQPLTPTRENRFSLTPVSMSQGYSEWPSLLELTLLPPANGPAERRGMALIDIDREKLAVRMRDYFSTLSDDELRSAHPELMPDSLGRGGKSLNAEKVRKDLLRHFRFDEARIVPYPNRPFDHLWAYLENLRPLFKEPSPELQELRDIPGNAFLLVREPNERATAGLAAWFSPYICDYDFFAGNSCQFPLYVDATMVEDTPRKRRRGAQKLLANTNPIPNLSPGVMKYLERITSAIRKYEDDLLAKRADLGAGAKHNSPHREHLDELLWHHILAVLFTPAYNRENEEALRRDWPRIPIPCWSHPDEICYAASALKHYPNIGKRIAELLSMRPLDSEDWPALTSIAVLTTQNGPGTENSQLSLSDTWAIRTKITAVRPGKGEVRLRKYSAKELDELAEVITVFGIAGTEVEEVFGRKMVDVFLNDGVCWRGVPEAVWEFELGGHKVLRKWLSYRAESVIERPLTLAECGIFTDIARRIALLVALGLRLDYLWPRLKDEAGR